MDCAVKSTSGNKREAHEPKLRKVELPPFFSGLALPQTQENKPEHNRKPHHDWDLRKPDHQKQPLPRLDRDMWNTTEQERDEKEREQMRPKQNSWPPLRTTYPDEPTVFAHLNGGLNVHRIAAELNRRNLLLKRALPGLLPFQHILRLPGHDGQRDL